MIHHSEDFKLSAVEKDFFLLKKSFPSVKICLQQIFSVKLYLKFKSIRKVSNLLNCKKSTLHRWIERLDKKN
jgi:hypothetical protein